MNRVFMSVVGASSYNVAEYRLDNETEKNRFVQKAILNILKRQDVDFDRIVFFLTPEAKNLNWEKYSRNDITDEGLKPFLEKLFPDKVTAVDIINASSEDEMLELFKKIYDSINENDVITFDVTHGFRSIPFLFFPVMSYAKELKNITIEHIYYGAYTPEKTTTEIIDLKKYDEIFDWANAAHNFRLSGNATEIAELTLKRYNSFENNEKITFNTSKELAKNLLLLTEALLTCNCDLKKNSISSSAKQVKKYEGKLKSNNESYVLFDEILKHALNSVNCFYDYDAYYKLGIEAVKWYKGRKLLQQAFTALQETVTTYFCSIFSNSYNETDNFFRENVVDHAINSYLRSIRFNSNPLNEIYNKPQLTQKAELAVIYIKIIKFLPLINIEYMNSVKSIRNKMNHFGMNSDDGKADMSALELHYQNTLRLIAEADAKRDKIISDEEAIKILRSFYPEKKPVFINFSNHPSELWSDEQIKAADDIVPDCKIIDVPFPQVNGSADDNEINLIAEEYISKIISLCPSAVMCQGEFGVCWNVINALLKKGIRVVYSCSERRAVEKLTENGAEKTSVFRFVRFRDYR